MSEINCSIIRDLLPLYTDGAVSSETAKAVSMHLEQCAVCSEEFEKMTRKLAIPAVKDAGIIKKLKARLLRKKVIISLGSVLGTLALGLGGFCFMTMYEIPMDYDEVKDHLVITDDGNGNYSLYTKDLNYYCAYGTSTESVSNDEKLCGDQSFVMGYTQNIWQKYFSSGKKEKISQLDMYDVENGKPTDKESLESDSDYLEEVQNDDGTYTLLRTVKVYYNKAVCDMDNFDVDDLGELVWERKE